jgi:hypothetical protein
MHAKHIRERRTERSKSERSAREMIENMGR